MFNQIAKKHSQKLTTGMKIFHNLFPTTQKIVIPIALQTEKVSPSVWLANNSSSSLLNSIGAFSFYLVRHVLCHTLNAFLKINNRIDNFFYSNNFLRRSKLPT